jgi:hypothetical protein
MRHRHRLGFQLGENLSLGFEPVLAVESIQADTLLLEVAASPLDWRMSPLKHIGFRRDLKLLG